MDCSTSGLPVHHQLPEFTQTHVHWVGDARSPMQETLVQSLGQEDPLEKEMATHSSILAWEIPLTEEHGWLQSSQLMRWMTTISSSVVPFSSRLQSFPASGSFQVSSSHQDGIQHRIKGEKGSELKSELRDISCISSPLPCTPSYNFID